MHKKRRSGHVAKLKGLKSVRGELKALRKKADRAMNRGIIKTAHDIKDSARASAPVDMGNLKRSIDVETKENTTFVYADPILAPHAPYVEFGTGDFAVAPAPEYNEYMREFFVTGKGTTRPQPYLFPAYFRHRDELVPNVEEELNKIK